MGLGGYSADLYESYSSVARSQTRDQVFTAKQSDDSYLAKNITTRESRDSEEHPNSNAIIIGFDVTGSMGNIPFEFVKHGLGAFTKDVFQGNVIEDPQVMSMAVGDITCDRSPIQALSLIHI